MESSHSENELRYNCMENDVLSTHYPILWDQWFRARVGGRKQLYTTRHHIVQIWTKERNNEAIAIAEAFEGRSVCRGAEGVTSDEETFWKVCCGMQSGTYRDLRAPPFPRGLLTSPPIIAVAAKAFWFLLVSSFGGSRSCLWLNANVLFAAASISSRRKC